MTRWWNATGQRAGSLQVQLTRGMTGLLYIQVLTVRWQSGDHQMRVWWQSDDSKITVRWLASTSRCWQSGDSLMTIRWHRYETDSLVQAWAGMTFAPLGLEIVNGQAYSHFWDWEWEWKIQITTFFGLGIGGKNRVTKPNLIFFLQKSSGKKLGTGCPTQPFPAGRRPNRFNYTARQKKIKILIKKVFFFPLYNAGLAPYYPSLFMVNLISKTEIVWIETTLFH